MLVDGHGRDPDRRITPDDHEGQVALDRDDRVDDAPDRRHDDDPLHPGRTEPVSVAPMSCPALSRVTKVRRWPALRAASSIPKSVCDGPNWSVSTATTPIVRDRPPARTRAAVSAW